MILQFGSGKGLIYSNNDVLIFGYFTYLRLKGIMFDQDENSYLKQFENSFPKKGKLLENKDEFMAILNNDIDYICIKFKSNCYFPKINCNLIKFVISVDAKDITIRKFQEIAESLNPETKVVVKIFGNW